MTTVAVVLRRTPPRRYAKGGLVSAAERVRGAGRQDDTMVVHITPTEVEFLKENFGEPTTNPETGLPEFGLFKSLKKVLKKGAPIISAVLPMVAPGVGQALGSALGAGAQWSGALGSGLIGAGLGALGGGGKGALTGGLLGGLSGYFSPQLRSTLGMEGVDLGQYIGLPGQGGGTITGAGITMPGGVTIDPTTGLPTGVPGATSAGPPGAALGAMTGSMGSATNPLTQAATAGSSGGIGNIAKYALPAALLLAGGSGGGKAKQPGIPDSVATPSDSNNQPLQQYAFNRRPADLGNIDWYTYGQRPEINFFDDNALPGDDDKKDDDKATAARGGRFARGGALSTQSRYMGDYSTSSARADDIDAKLSPKEYVLDGETVALLGDGNPDAGADRLDQMRMALRKHKGGALARGKFSPNAKAPLAYMRGGRY